jgi:hypothetical protein
LQETRLMPVNTKVRMIYVVRLSTKVKNNL